MSYFSNRGKVRPGHIDGNATDGLSNRACISVNRVLDSCKKQISHNRVKLVLEHPQGKPPYKFIGATSTASKATVTDLTVTRLEQRTCFARIKCNVNVPMQVEYCDADNVQHFAPSEVTFHQDIVMYVPEASIFPFEIVAVASANCSTGEFVSETELLVFVCMTLITKVVASTDLLVPTYGFCPSPDAVDFESQACNKFFDLPLYPK